MNDEKIIRMDLKQEIKCLKAIEKIFNIINDENDLLTELEILNKDFNINDDNNICALEPLKIESKIINVFSSIVLVVGKILLVLIILDYWNIGKTIIGALANGLTFTLAIALGLAFGKALEPEAKKLVEGFKSKLENK